MPQPVNIVIGQKYNLLTIVDAAGLIGNRKAVLCRCECGREKIVLAVAVYKGTTKSCGCLLRQAILTASKTHGQFGTELYRRWADMKKRCFNPKVKGYEYYGGRGITVCEDWLSFESFMCWALNNGYEQGLSLERLRTDDNYQPDNCTWIPVKMQAKNRRSNNVITINGESMILQDWCNKLNIPQSRVSRRLGLGWSVEDALFTQKLSRCAS